MSSRTETVDLVAMSLKKSHFMQPQFELLARVLSAGVLIPFFLWITYAGGWLFQGVLILVFIAALREWSRLSTNSIFHPFCFAALIGLVLCFFKAYTLYVQIGGALLFIGTLYYQRNTFNLVSIQRWAIFLGGLAYITTSIMCFVQLSQLGKNGSLFILWIYGIVWATDSGAYIIGRTIKGPKLSPRISPNKTISGFIGGIITAIFAGQYMLKTLGLDLSSSAPVFTLIILFSLAAHAGDLIESAIKRYFGVKNAGDLIPGHGGVLDRLDSLFLVIIMTGLLLMFKIISI